MLKDEGALYFTLLWTNIHPATKVRPGKRSYKKIKRWKYYKS